MLQGYAMNVEHKMLTFIFVIFSILGICMEEKNINKEQKFKL